MSMRHNRQPRVARSARARTHRFRGLGARRRLWSGSIALLLPLALVLVAVLAPIGQARPASERSPEEAALILSKKEALHAERDAARKAKHESKWKTEVERSNGVVKTSCTQIVWTFRGFPELPDNTVTLKLKINRVVTWSTYSFDGPTSTLTMPINAPPGHYKIDTRSVGRTNGFRAAFDIGMSVNCPTSPAYSVEKLQQIDGSGGSYTPSQLTGQVGQTVDYEILVKNTGNVPLSFGSLSDPRCDPGTISGGPGGPLAAGATATYLCTHLLTAADLSAGSVSNMVTLTGTPPEGQGSPIKHTSNTVVVEPVPASPPIEPPPTTTTTTATTTSSTPSGGVLPSSSAQSPSSGVLALKQSSVPALKVTLPKLKGPQGCVRSSFRASVKSAGVASVAFYMDGHRLKTLTAKSARKGQISMMIDPTKLRVGAHRLMARITMAKASASTSAVRGSRTAVVLRCAAAVLTPKFTG